MEVTRPATLQMPEGERGAAAATGESSTTLLVGLACGNACKVISVPRAKAAPRRKFVLRYPTLAYQHEQPSHIHHGWQPQAPSRSPSGNGLTSHLNLQRDTCGLLTKRSHINVGHERRVRPLCGNACSLKFDKCLFGHLNPLCIGFLESLAIESCCFDRCPFSLGIPTDVHLHCLRWTLRP